MLVTRRAPLKLGRYVAALVIPSVQAPNPAIAGSLFGHNRTSAVP
jgi:hypothetical protein